MVLCLRTPYALAGQHFAPLLPAALQPASDATCRIADAAAAGRTYQHADLSPSAHQPVSQTVARVEMAPASAGGAGHSSAAALYQAAPHRPTVAPMSGNHITAGS